MDDKKYLNFSIIIPTRNRADSFLKTLEKIERIEYQGKWEVIIVDNNSKDKTKRLVDSFLGRNKNFYYIKEKRIGLSFARNTGIKKSIYDYLLFIDDDILVESNILEKFNCSFRKFPQATGIGARIILKDELKNYKLFLKFIPWVFTITTRLNSVECLRFPDFLFGACICFQKDKIIGNFFNTIIGRSYGNFYLGGEDVEFCLRLLHKKHILIYDASIQVIHKIKTRERLSFIYLIKRFIQTGIENRLIEKILHTQNIQFNSWEWQRNQLNICLRSLIHCQDVPSRLVQLLQIILFRLGYDFWWIFIKQGI